MRLEFIFILLISLNLLGCGTDSGNPGVTSNGENQPGSARENYLALSPCAVANRCRSSSVSTCYAAVVQQSGLPEVLGASFGRFDNLDAVFTAIQSSLLRLNSETLDECIQAIEATACDSPVIERAFHSSLNDDFSRIGELYKEYPSCAQVIPPL